MGIIFGISNIAAGMAGFFQAYFFIKLFQVEVRRISEMPVWVFFFYQTSHFLAMLPPALYAYIFCTPQFLLNLCQVKLFLNDFSYPVVPKHSTLGTLGGIP